MKIYVGIENDCEVVRVDTNLKNVTDYLDFLHQKHKGNYYTYEIWENGVYIETVGYIMGDIWISQHVALTPL